MILDKPQDMPGMTELEADRDDSPSKLGESPFCYYLKQSCPDWHVKQVLRTLLSVRLNEGIAEDDDHDLSHLQNLTLSYQEAERLRFLMAASPNTPSNILESIVMKASATVRERIAENPQASPDTLARLGFDPCPEVRAAVAENMNTPVETAWMLATDECPDVRLRLAECYHLSENILHALVDDENPYVACRARETLRRLEIHKHGENLRVLNSLLATKRLYRYSQ